MAAELQNISKAAEKLNISQPSLSKSISKLEKELGTPLFDRVGKKIILNEQGSRFLAGVQSSLQELDETMSIVSSAADFAKIKLTLGIFAIYPRIIKCLNKFVKTNPKVEFVIHSNIASLEQMPTDAFDMLVYPLDTAFKKYKGYIIGNEKFKLVLSRTNKLSAMNAVSVKDLVHEPFAFIRNANNSLGLPYHVLISAGLRPEIKYTADSIDSHRQLLSNGFAVGIVSEGNLDAYLIDPNLTALDITDIETQQPVLIGFKREKHLSETARQFRDFVVNYFKIKIQDEQ